MLQGRGGYNYIHIHSKLAAHSWPQLMRVCVTTHRDNTGAFHIHFSLEYKCEGFEVISLFLQYWNDLLKSKGIWQLQANNSSTNVSTKSWMNPLFCNAWKTSCKKNNINALPFRSRMEGLTASAAIWQRAAHKGEAVNSWPTGSSTDL